MCAMTNVISTEKLAVSSGDCDLQEWEERLRIIDRTIDPGVGFRQQSDIVP